MRKLCLLIAAAMLACVQAATAQGLFGPVVTVNGRAVTGYELEQRARFLQLLNAPGNPKELARTQLIEDRLKMDEAARVGLVVSEEEITEGMAEFAGRANLETADFIRALSQGGVDEETFRDFITSGVAWRVLVRERFRGQAEISDSEVDRAVSGASGGSNVRVLLSEIIMPAPPPQAQAVMARAQTIAQTRSTAEFSAYARQYSATASRGAGGQLPWQNLTDLPPQLRPLIVGLAPGEVTDPLPIPNAVALFQLRAIEETAYSAPDYAAIEYAALLLPGGRSDATLAEARRIADSVDRCDDLYGINKGRPDELLIRESKDPAEVPQDIATQISSLDAGEVSYGLTRPTSAGDALVLVMLCGRTPAIAEDADRDQIALGLRNQRLAALADGYLANLRARARIIEK
ncbi:peptidylprolyl isomerase [Mesobacterium pallidum]|uniref:peptidylprolyl isomerase n=1 Tax=Mesobacterium pallidum TaxID=2872037 RepID=UPI001EE2083C|nr:peptidylprolyl isomerase [Mesobacterium pallidum]